MNSKIKKNAKEYIDKIKLVSDSNNPLNASCEDINKYLDLDLFGLKDPIPTNMSDGEIDDYGMVKYAYKNFVHTCLVMKFTKYNGVTLEELREVYLNYDNLLDHEKQEAIRERKEQAIACTIDFLYWKLYNKYSPSKQLSIVMEVCEMFSVSMSKEKIIKERNNSMYWINAIMSFDDFDLTSQLAIDN